MSKRSVLLLVVSALLLTAFSVALSRRDSRDWRANRSRRLLPFPWQDTASVHIRRPNGEDVLFSRMPGEEWRFHFADGHADTLDPGAVEEFAALATLAWRSPLADRAPPDPDAAVQLTVRNQAGQSVALTFGDIAQNMRATCIDGDASVVYGVSQDLLGFLDWPAERFRKLYLANVAGGRQPHRILLEGRPDAPETSIVLERSDHVWTMRAPLEWPVDDAGLDQLLRWLDRLRADAIVAETADDPALYGFAPPGAAIEAWYDTPDGQIRHRIEFGKEDGEGGVFAREAGREPVFSLPASTLAEIAMDRAGDNPAEWCNHFRRRELDLVGDKTPVSVTVRQLLPKPVTLDMQFDPVSGTWRGQLDADGRSREFAVEPPVPWDKTRPLTALFSGLACLRIEDFPSDQPPGPETLRWTAYPAWRITTRFADGGTAPELTLYAADAMGTLPAGMPFADGAAEPRDTEGDGGLIFSLADRPVVLEGSAELAHSLCLPPYRYQSRRILHESAGNWRRVERAMNGKTETFIRPNAEVNEQWWRQDRAAEPLMDGNNRFVAMLQALAQLESDGFVSDGDGDIAEFGLDQPEITAIVYSSPEPEAEEEQSAARLFELSLGKTDGEDGRRYARLNGAGPVFLLPAEISGALGERYE